MVEDLEDIGSRLDLDEDDIESIRRKKRREMLLAPVIGLIVTFLVTLIGFFIGKGDTAYDRIYPSSYPYAGFLLLSFSAGNINKKLWITVGVITILASLIGFFAAHEFAQPHEYGIGIEYGVYSR